jgi:hypothetical protein
MQNQTSLFTLQHLPHLLLQNEWSPPVCHIPGGVWRFLHPLQVQLPASSPSSPRPFPPPGRQPSLPPLSDFQTCLATGTVSARSDLFGNLKRKEVTEVNTYRGRCSGWGAVACSTARTLHYFQTCMDTARHDTNRPEHFWGRAEKISVI